MTDESKETELKPCECGGDAVISAARNLGTPDMRLIFCRACDNKGHRTTVLRDTLEQAIEAWNILNTRPEPKEAWQPIELNEQTQKIMGYMCFTTARFAHKLIELGLYPKQPENQKAEYEQAIFMHWALNLEAEHGAAWMDVGQEILSPSPEQQEQEQ